MNIFEPFFSFFFYHIVGRYIKNNPKTYKSGKRFFQKKQIK